MLTAVLTPHLSIASAFASKLGLEKLPAVFGSASAVYRKGNVVVVVSDSTGAVAEVKAEYLPERLYYASFGTSATSERYAGDVVLPNAFVPYCVDGESEEEAVFLENYEEQEDYDFETFGLSIGGVCVSTGKELDEETLMKISSEYGADLVDEKGIEAVSGGLTDDEFVIYPVYGVTGGIVGNDDEDVKESAVANNMAAVFRFLEDSFANEGEPGGDDEDEDDEVTLGENDE
ncbi:MAG: hypothetical protein WA194_08155 [Patescibacteria group bacterium]